MSHDGYSLVDNVKKPLALLIADTFTQNFINLEHLGRSVFDTQDERHKDISFDQSTFETIHSGAELKFTCNDSGGTGSSLPPGGSLIWDVADSKIIGLKEKDVIFVAIRADVRFTTGSAEIQFFIRDDGGVLDPILTPNLALEVPNAQQWGFVQPFFVLMLPAGLEGASFEFLMRATDGDAFIGERAIDIYKAFTRTEDSDIEGEEQVRQDLLTQWERNGVDSSRSKFERLAVVYQDDRFSDTVFETMPANTFIEFTADGSEETTLNLIGSQKSPWDEVTYRLVDLQPNGVYLVTCFYRLNTDLQNESAIFRIVDTQTADVVSGSTTSEDSTTGWQPYGLTIFFTAPAVTEGKTYKIEILHKTAAKLGARTIQVVQLA